MQIRMQTGALRVRAASSITGMGFWVPLTTERICPLPIWAGVAGSLMIQKISIQCEQREFVLNRSINRTEMALSAPQTDV